MKDIAISSLAQAIEDEKKEQWRVEGRAMLFDAKRVSATDLSPVVHKGVSHIYRNLGSYLGFKGILLTSSGSK